MVEAYRKNIQYSLDGMETKLLIPGSKPRIYEGFTQSTRKRKLKSTRKII